MEKLITVKELEQKLGVKRSTIYAYLSDGKLRKVQGVGCLRFRPSEIERFLSGRQKMEKKALSSKIKTRTTGTASVSRLSEIVARAKAEVLE